MTYTDGPVTDGCAGSYSFTRTFTATATDHCGNEDSVSCDQLITVSDATAPDAPVITGPADAEVLLDADCMTDASTAVTGEPRPRLQTTATRLRPSPSRTRTAPRPTPARVTTRPRAATRSRGRSRPRPRTTAATWAPPTPTCRRSRSSTRSPRRPPAVATTFEIACDLYDENTAYDVTAADNCDSDVTITILSNTQVSGSCAGAFLRTYEATDDCGNSTQWEQAISLIDTVAPALTLTCPADATLEADRLRCGHGPYGPRQCHLHGRGQLRCRPRHQPDPRTC